MIGSFRQLLAAIPVTQPALEPAPGEVIRMPDNIDKLMKSYERERSKHVHEMGERDKLDLQFEALRAEYEEIRHDIEARMGDHAAAMESIQRRIAELLKQVNIKAEILPVSA